FRRYVRPVPGRDGGNRSRVSPGRATLELEVLHGEPARRLTPVGNAPVHGDCRGKGRAGFARRGTVAAAVLSLSIDFRVVLRAVGFRADSQLSARSRDSER